MKRYVITTAVPGAKLNLRFFASIQKYCKLNNAKLLILPSEKVYKEDELDGNIPVENLVMEDRQLNEKIRLSRIPVNPQAVDPIAGLGRQSQKDGSFIFASPKQRLKVMPNSNVKLPHVLMTTGAVTKPYYKATRNGIVAASDHVTGALIVETIGASEYHFRQVQADLSGKFIDLGYQYSHQGKQKVEVEALVGGDWHAGETDPVVDKAIFEMLKAFKPKYFVAHDFFNGESVNPHTEHKFIERSNRGKASSLEYELGVMTSDLVRLCKAAGEVIIVRSNHDIFLDRWLEAGTYVQDSLNHQAGLQLALAKAKGWNPLEYWVDTHTNNTTNYRFLKLDEDFKITPAHIQCGAHGHIGSNGARATTAGTEKAYGVSVTGHCLTKDHSVNVKGKGWVPIAEVKPGETVLGYNPSGENKWTEVKEKQLFDYSGTIYHVGNNSWKQSVTEGHHFYTKDGKYVSLFEAIKSVPISDIPYELDRESVIVSKKEDESLTKWQVIPEQVSNIQTHCLTTETHNFWVRNDETGQVSLTGNSHTPEILREAFVVGTSTPLKVGYNSGPSSWMQTSCVVYKNGSRQLLNVINGKWKA